MQRAISNNAGTSSLSTSSTAQNISQYTSLNSKSDVDTDDDDATQFGLHVYGSGAPTGVVIDSGDEQVGWQCCHRL